MKPVETLSQDELVLESVRLRDQMVSIAERMQRVNSLLYSRSRRDLNDLYNAFVHVSNANKRFASAVLQGARRLEASVKFLSKQQERVAQERVEREKAEQDRAERDKAKKAKSGESIRNDPYRVFSSPNSTTSDLDALYGED